VSTTAALAFVVYVLAIGGLAALVLWDVLQDVLRPLTAL
jgi:hypothetical protein